MIGGADFARVAPRGAMRASLRATKKKVEPTLSDDRVGVRTKPLRAGPVGVGTAGVSDDRPRVLRTRFALRYRDDPLCGAVVLFSVRSTARRFRLGETRPALHLGRMGEPRRDRGGNAERRRGPRHRSGRSGDGLLDLFGGRGVALSAEQPRPRQRHAERAGDLLRRHDIDASARASFDEPHVRLREPSLQAERLWAKAGCLLRPLDARREIFQIGLRHVLRTCNKRYVRSQDVLYYVRMRLMP